MSLTKIESSEEERIIDDAIDAATDALFLRMQRAINQTDGGIAGIFFQGEKEEQVKALLAPMMKEYLEFEYTHMDSDFG